MTILQDTLRTDCDSASNWCQTNCYVSPVLATVYFVLFVMLAQFVLLNVVVAMLMKGFEDSSNSIIEEEKQNKNDL